MVVSAGRFLWFSICLESTGAMVGSMSLQPVFSRYQIITDAWENYSCWKTHLVLGNVYGSLRFSLIDESSLFETVNGLSCGNQSVAQNTFCLIVEKFFMRALTKIM